MTPQAVAPQPVKPLDPGPPVDRQPDVLPTAAPHPLAAADQRLQAVIHAELAPRGLVLIDGCLWPAIWRGSPEARPVRGEAVWVRVDRVTSPALLVVGRLETIPREELPGGML